MSAVGPDQRRPLTDPLTAGNIKNRFLDGFPHTYLTSIAIIQGVALHILANEVLRDFRPQGFVDFAPLAYAFLTLMFMIVVSYEYSWFIALFRWPPALLDSAVPLILGAFEVAPAFFIDPGAPGGWWITTGLFLATGVPAFIYTRARCTRGVFAIDAARALTVDTLNKSAGAAALMSGIAFAAAWAVEAGALWLQWPAGVFLLVIVVFLTTKDRAFLVALRQLHAYE